MSTQPPVEDINAIVSRFQAWAGAQAPARAKDGVRELTYDEAIRSSRHRSRMEEPLPEVEKSAPTSPANTKQTKTGKSAKAKKRINTARHTKRDQRESRERPRTNRSVPAAESPVFREVFVEKVSILPAPASQELGLAERRTTALSLRISFAEHALLRKRAAEANLSVSCYLRNCVFEVEELREQVNALRAADEAPRLVQHRGGILDGIGRFLGEFFGGNKSALTLRA
jgi:hypothetical protein